MRIIAGGYAVGQREVAFVLCELKTTIYIVVDDIVGSVVIFWIFALGNV